MQELLKYIYTELMTFACNICNDNHSAQDLVQETCYKFFRNHEKYLVQPLENQKVLCRVILYNTFIDDHRRKEVKPKIIRNIYLGLGDDNDLCDIVLKDKSYLSNHKMYEDYILNEMKTSVQFKSFYLQICGYTTREIAYSYGEGFSVNTVLGHIRYARSKAMKHFKLIKNEAGKNKYPCAIVNGKYLIKRKLKAA